MGNTTLTVVEGIKRCNDKPINSAAKVEIAANKSYMQDPTKIRDIILSRTHVTNPQHVAKLVTALENILALKMPFINRLLEMAAHLVCQKRLSIYIADNNEQLDEPEKEFGYSIHLGFLELVWCLGNENLEETLVHELMHVAQHVAIKSNKQFSQNFLFNLEKECAQPPTFNQKRAREHWAYQAIIKMKFVPLSLNFPYFKNDINSLQMLNDIYSQLGAYKRKEYQGEFLSFLLQTFVRAALNQTDGDISHAMEYFSAGALEYRAVLDDKNSFYRVLCLHYPHETIESLRKKVADHMQRNSYKYYWQIPEEYRYSQNKYHSSYYNRGNLFSPMVAGDDREKYFSDVRQGIAAVDNLQISVLQELVNRPIIIISEKGKIINKDKILTGDNDAQQPLFVYHYNGHYDGLIFTGNSLLCNNGWDVLRYLQQFQLNSSPFHQALENSTYQHQDLVRLDHAMLLWKTLENMPQLTSSEFNSAYSKLEAYARAVIWSSMRLEDDEAYSSVFPSTTKIHSNFSYRM